MNPAQSRRERHEKYRESGETLDVRRHGKIIGGIKWQADGWHAFSTLVGRGTAGVGTHRDPVKAEMAVVRNATDRA